MTWTSAHHDGQELHFAQCHFLGKASNQLLTLHAAFLDKFEGVVRKKVELFPGPFQHWLQEERQELLLLRWGPHQNKRRFALTKLFASHVCLQTRPSSFRAFSEPANETHRATK